MLASIDLALRQQCCLLFVGRHEQRNVCLHPRGAAPVRGPTVSITARPAVAASSCDNVELIPSTVYSSQSLYTVATVRLCLCARVCTAQCQRHTDTLLHAPTICSPYHDAERGSETPWLTFPRSRRSYSLAQCFRHTQVGAIA